MKRSTKAQVTIFVILAIIIFAVILIILYPRVLKPLIAPSTGDPLPKDCIEKSVREALNKTMSQGGYTKPELYFRYNNETIGYLCYTSEWYKTCIIQNPLVKQSIEKEAGIYAEKKINSCIDSMEARYKSQGYDVKISGSKKAIISIIPEKISISFNMSMTAEKGENKLAFSQNAFRMDLNSKAYDIVMISTSIMNYEARYSDSEILGFMSIYPDLKIQKLKYEDGTKIYTIESRETGEIMQFASRSLSWPAGYAFG